MPLAQRYEQQFFEALTEIFVGAPVEGESGYINLMRIKSRYFTEGVLPQLRADIEAACAPFAPAFREELFDKLYAFFSRYFSESGAIYFRHTPLHQNVYERVYTDERDVLLFWKTAMLYYVKTDRLFRSMDVEVDGFTFHFDVTALEHKRANEKRTLVYTCVGYRGGKVVLGVAYSESGRKTKERDILRALAERGLAVSEDTLRRACRIFEQQAEVDYFINKNAGAFLREQFDLWLYQYVFADETTWTEMRLQQLQALKRVAYRLIDFIAQFEDELVRVWNKPRFVLNSHYILTLDKLSDPELRARVLAHPGMAAQVEEWRTLGLVDAAFDPACLSERNLLDAPLYPRYEFLPLDTRYFPDLELDILAQFDDLDAALDGWLIHSENYQALNTLRPKFQGRVQCVHIDPPYNTATSGFLYANTYQHASWLTMMENRAAIAVDMLNHDGSFLCHIDENEYERLHLLFGQLAIPNVGTIVWDKRNPMNAGRGVALQHEYIIWRSRRETPIYLRNDSILAMLSAAADIIRKHGGVTEQAQKEYTVWVNSNSALTGGEKSYRFLDEQGRIYQSVSLRAPEPRADSKFHIPLIHPTTGKPCPVPPNGFSRTPETLQGMMRRNEIIFGADETIQPRQKVLLTAKTARQISSLIQDAKKGKADLDPLGLDFPYCHPISLYTKLIGAAMDTPNDLALDFFAGSGTTAHAVISLNRADGGRRKYILVEMGRHFHDVILPRIKKAVFSDQWKDGVAQEGQGISHFAKYYALEQYEDTLRRASYADAPLFAGQDAYSGYVFLRDLKLLEAVTLDTEHNQVRVQVDKLYTGIDLAETLSCVTGRPIRRITRDQVVFTDGTGVSLTDPDWELLKPLLWW
ncbi:MAG: site-specific DNA-methyltransferase [Anaerolineae bacterium]|jgi:adenine-specific DNA-methyltransferase|nr:site-specific DNA-methyltransferase [Anaerolineae bacterium]